MIEDESEVFEITDFTTASDWERFIARLEEIIHEWKLSYHNGNSPLAKGDLANGKWSEKVEHLQFADFKFVITRISLTSKDEPEEQAAGEQRESSVESNSEQAKDEAKGGSEGGEDEVPMIWRDMMSSENDFPGRAHCMARWYGLRDFVVVAPAPGMQDIGSESRANLLLSSVSIALNNTTCQIPVFIHVHQRWRRLYYGHCEMPGFRTAFEMVHLRSIPHQFSHLAGLLDVFKSKLACPVTPEPPVSVAVRFTYTLQDWTHYSWTQQPPDFDTPSGGEVGITEYGDLPFGACEDPVTELHLSTTWPSLSEEMIVDNDIYSDLDPLQAPSWSARIVVMDHPQCLLGDYLSTFVLLCRRQESTDQLLSRHMLDADEEGELDAAHALSRLTDPGLHGLPSIGTVVTRATSKLAIKPEEAPIPADLLNEILVFLFPDAKADAAGSDTASNPSVSTAATPSREDAPSFRESGSSKGVTPSPSLTGSIAEAACKEMFKQFKSAPPGSLTYRLAVCMCIVNHSYGGLKAVAHLWQEFVLEMRYRWENNYTVPDVEAGAPNMGCSVLHQKLQMLNCCIDRKRGREEAQEGEPRNATESGEDETDAKLPPSPRSVSSVSSEDEFFECDDVNGTSSQAGASKPNVKSDKDQSNLQKKQKQQHTTSKDTANASENAAGDSAGEDSPMDVGSAEDPSSASKDPPSSVGSDSPFADTVSHTPEGRRATHMGLSLINIDEPMYVPMTQDPSPMTEDMLEEHAEVLAKLGTSAEGAHLRARMQSACLLSDMEAFKAANPGCTLGDFVRWYSPRDWVETEVVDADGNVTHKHQLSQRMQIPGNMWVEVWQSAKPVPARRQRRLFDDTKEAEKVLHWMASLKPGDVALRLMPMLIHASIDKVIEQEESSLPVVRKMLAQLTDRATRAMRAQKMEVKRFEELVRQLIRAEIFVTRAQSLLTKFSQEKAELEVSYADLQDYVTAFLEHGEIPVLGGARGPLGTIVHRLFVAAQKSAYLLPEEGDEEEEEGEKTPVSIPDFPAPVGREYILRTAGRRPAPWSRESPQRMYCVLQKDDFRLAGAFTADTTFQ